MNAGKASGLSPVNEIVNISIKDLIPTQELSFCTRTSLIGLTKSIIEKGFISGTYIDIFVHNGKYHINNGHHRVLSSVLAGLDSIPCKVEVYDEYSNCDLNLSELAIDLWQGFIHSYKGYMLKDRTVKEEHSVMEYVRNSKT